MKNLKKGSKVTLSHKNNFLTLDILKSQRKDKKKKDPFKTSRNTKKKSSHYYRSWSKKTRPSSTLKKNLLS